MAVVHFAIPQNVLLRYSDRIKNKVNVLFLCFLPPRILWIFWMLSLNYDSFPKIMLKKIIEYIVL